MPALVHRRRASSWLLWAALAVAGLLAADLAALAALRWRLHRAVDEWAAQCETQGAHIALGTPVSGGWPFAVRLSYAEARASGLAAGLPVALDLAADRLAAETSLFRPGQLRLAATNLRLTSPGLPGGTLLADKAATVLSPGTPWSRIELEKVRLAAGSLQPAAFASSAWIERPLQPDTEMSVQVGAADIVLPLLNRSEAPPVRDVAATLHVHGGVQAAGPLSSRLAAWRRDGGQIGLHVSHIGWGPAEAEGNATITLDEQEQPEGAGTLRVRNWKTALALLARNGLLSQRAAQAIGGALALLSVQEEGSDVETVQLPFSISHQVVSIGPVPVWRFALVEWPVR